MGQIVDNSKCYRKRETYNCLILEELARCFFNNVLHWQASIVIAQFLFWL